MSSTPPPPPQVEAAVGQLSKALEAAEGRAIDPLAAPWEEIERGVIKLLGGAFTPREEAHQSLAFMIAAAFAERLRRELGAFWFPNRATPQGAALGFSAGIIVFSPFGAAVQALGRGRLTMLDDLKGELGRVLAQARAEALGRPDAALGPDDYQRLFDPGFVQFVAVKPADARAAWNELPAGEVRALEDAFSRLPAQVPREAREPMREQLVGALRQLDPAKPIGAQIAAAPQLAELLGLLHGAVAQTGYAPAELWEGVLLPLLHIGAAETFPEIDEEVTEAFKRGAAPILLYVDTVPYQTPAADEDGLLGVFPPEEIQLLDAAFEQSESVRLARVDPAILRPLVDRFDGPAVRASVERFKAALEEEAPAPPDPRPGEPSLLDVAIVLLEDLARVVKTAVEKDAALCVRHATESEAGSDQLVAEVRRALTGPRIIIP